MRLALLGLLSVGTLTLGAGCGGGGLVEPDGPEDVTFHHSLGVDLSQMTKTASGLYYQDLVVGTGELAMAGDDVTVHYTGWLHTGVKFDSSYDRGQPSTFSLNQVIDGWQEGVPGMRVGGKRKLVVPPHLGYGTTGSFPSIPPNAILVFDIELLGREAGS
jgi:FKBP-type peptidyl-prolyl cis-trans isomerase